MRSLFVRTARKALASRHPTPGPGNRQKGLCSLDFWRRFSKGRAHLTQRNGDLRTTAPLRDIAFLVRHLILQAPLKVTHQPRNFLVRPRIQVLHDAGNDWRRQHNSPWLSRTGADHGGSRNRANGHADRFYIGVHRAALSNRAGRYNALSLAGVFCPKLNRYGWWIMTGADC